MSGQNVSSPVTSQNNTDTGINSEPVSPFQPSETQHNTNSTDTGTGNDNNLQCLSAVSISKNSEKSVPQNPFFRPFNTDTAKSPNSENPKRAEHVSRTLQRGTRRCSSLSLPRAKQRGTSPVKTKTKNKQCSGKNNSVSRANSKSTERGAKNMTITENGDKNSQATDSKQD